MRKLLAFFLALGIAQAVHAEVRNPHGVAVIVGNGDYEHRDVPDVAYASRDAAAFARYVTDVLGFDPENVIRVTDATRRKMFDLFGTKSDLRGDLWSRLDPDGGSEVVVFYSGHGVPGQRDGRGYLLPVDADPEAAEDDGYPIDLLYGNLGRLEEASSVRVYLDACFSGGSHGGGLIGSASPVFVKAALPEGLSGKVTALAAASGTQIASWDEDARHGLFTHHLLDALYGKGDADGDGKVTGGEARAYLDRYMTRAARRQHRRVQRASLIGADGAVLSSAPAGGFPKRPVPDGTDDAAAERAKASAESHAAYLSRSGRHRQEASSLKTAAAAREEGAPRTHEKRERLAREEALRGGETPTRHSVERAKYERGLERARQEKDHAAVLSFLDRMEKLGGEQLSAEDFFRGEAAFFLGRYGSARAALERHAARGGGKHYRESLGLLLELDKKDDAAAARAREADTAEGYKAYLSSWPDGWHAEEMRRLGSMAVAREVALQEAGTVFRDCPQCPEMVVVTAGSFMMGSPPSEEGREDDEGPRHRVRISEPFAVGKYEVTFAEWDACASDGGCGGYRPNDRGRNNRPVGGVSWHDAKSYVEWLSRKTGKGYRLLSESEWEYAARAGTRGPFHTGGTISTDQANYDGHGVYGSGRKGVYRRKTVPVGSFAPNGFGLHDMHGNVWEWVEDCWNVSYAGAPADGSAWESGGCGQRVLRGGSRDRKPGYLRSANR